ncbi:hypothetical protein COHA_004341 [Chlorella ohadii]|uniref:Uncharacterized protein n=1 Tax=Chlorella ohadii TaxID=2649997 RepID=A0AAD5H5U7_9CHLO|nr:hypothetical protein COHA_004341 [Chlorella ohadii]
MQQRPVPAAGTPLLRREQQQQQFAAANQQVEQRLQEQERLLAAQQAELQRRINERARKSRRWISNAPTTPAPRQQQQQQQQAGGALDQPSGGSGADLLGSFARGGLQRKVSRFAELTNQLLRSQEDRGAGVSWGRRQESASAAEARDWQTWEEAERQLNVRRVRRPLAGNAGQKAAQTQPLPPQPQPMQPQPQQQQQAAPPPPAQAQWMQQGVQPAATQPWPGVWSLREAMKLQVLALCLLALAVYSEANGTYDHRRLSGYRKLSGYRRSLLSDDSEAALTGRQLTGYRKLLLSDSEALSGRQLTGYRKLSGYRRSLLSDSEALSGRQLTGYRRLSGYRKLSSVTNPLENGIPLARSLFTARAEAAAAVPLPTRHGRRLSGGYHSRRLSGY